MKTISGRIGGGNGLYYTEESMRALERFLVSEIQAAHDALYVSRYRRLGDELTKLRDSEAYKSALGRPV